MTQCMTALAAFSHSPFASMRLKDLNALRQWRYPAEFRIVADTESDELDNLLVCLAKEILESRAASTATRLQLTADGGAARVLLDQKKFIVELCNQYFRLCSHVANLSKEKRVTGDMKPLQRALERVQKLFQGEAIVCTDLSGQDYDEGRADFERFGEFEIRQGLVGRVIVECERPLVMSGGRIWQKAKGTVAIPG